LLSFFLELNWCLFFVFSEFPFSQKSIMHWLLNKR